MARKAESTEVKIKPAKGRPMLTWVGKRPLRHVTAFPAQHIETFSPLSPSAQRGELVGSELWKDWPADYPKGGLLFHGDNKEVLAHLLVNGFRGKVNLIYIDPPFDSGADYVRKVQLRGVSGTAKLDGESYALGEQIQYTDIWANDNYLQFMYERLLLLKELLTDNGNILLHCDPRRAHHLRCLMDEIFGSEKTFKNEIIWFYRRWPTDTPAFQTMHDNILWYSKCNDNSHVFHKLYEEASERTLSDYGGKRLTTVQTEDGSFVKRETDEESLGVSMRDVWEIRREHPRGHEHTDYPTQKPTGLLERIIIALSNPGDLVLDSYIGSGTTAAVAQRLGRRWIGCDINKGAIQTTSKRLQAIIKEQADTRTLPGMETGEDQPPAPAQFSFTVWRVNDYDLQIQHNEAVNLACEHIGVQRTRADSFFDGTLGKKLVKIVPFGHPLTPLDLEEIKKELEARPDEDRNITVVCLGKELAADAWLEEWNRLRKKDAVNKIDVIELRSDPNYGGFIAHEPAKAKVSVKRAKARKGESKIKVEIEDFISPTIVQRLDIDLPLFKAKITDWRSMVDCVMIDTAYDGKVFAVALADVPEKKDDWVRGEYELDAPEKETTVAVKIIDMLGEEVLVTKSV
jgi:DNA modification methylase